MNVADAEEYTEALSQVTAGGWRQILLGERLGVPETLGLSTREWVERRIGGYVRLSILERREAVTELTDDGMSQREIADVLGVSAGTVNADLNPGSVQNRTLEPGSTWSEPVDESLTVQNRTPEPLSTRDLLARSDENEWYTPRRFIEAASGLLGGIDLDPASSAAANQIVRAERFYTIDDDGLTQPWKGTIWLNPPYGGQNRLFVERLIREYEAGNVTAAVLLVNCHPAETAWFQRLFEYTVCFVRGRIDFTGPARDRASTSTHGSAIVYLGPDWAAFADAFARFGAVVRRV